jgi:Predicted integral membrane protein (DUF2269)
LLASITAYGVGVFLHVLAVVIAFGVTFAFPFMGAVTAKVDPRALPAMHRTIDAIHRFLITPGIVVVLLAGLYAVEEGNWDYGESWISVGFAAILVLFGMLHAFFAPNNRKGLEMIERDLQSGGEPSAEYLAVTQRVARGGQLATLIIVVAIFFMTVKP